MSFCYLFLSIHIPHTYWKERCLFWECDNWISTLCLSQLQETDQLVDGTMQLEGKTGEAMPRLLCPEDFLDVLAPFSYLVKQLLLSLHSSIGLLHFLYIKILPIGALNCVFNQNKVSVWFLFDWMIEIPNPSRMPWYQRSVIVFNSLWCAWRHTLFSLSSPFPSFLGTVKHLRICLFTVRGFQSGFTYIPLWVNSGK